MTVQYGIVLYYIESDSDFILLVLHIHPLHCTGYYGFEDTATEFTESSPKGSGFLSEVCAEWEGEALKYSKAGRTVCIRNGVVLSKKGGLLAKLAPLFNLGGGGNIGSGQQGLSWVSVDDAVSGIEFALNSSKLSGPVNLCAPTPASNAEFTSALGRYNNCQ
jgi:uncharacterized protein